MRCAGEGVTPCLRTHLALPRRAQVVDKFNDLLVSCYSTAGHARLLLLHDSRLGEEAVRAFFQDAHELYLKARTRADDAQAGEAARG